MGAASTVAALQDQKVLNGNSDKLSFDFNAASDIHAWTKPLEGVLGEFTSEAKSVWDEVSMLMPEAVEAFKKNALNTKAKPANRRPDSHWDHIVKGAELHDMWANDESKKSAPDSALKNYNLRAKSVDPSKLGVDTVKQYSGYLDDEKNDKHLFYCKFNIDYIDRAPAEFYRVF